MLERHRLDWELSDLGLRGGRMYESTKGIRLKGSVGDPSRATNLNDDVRLVRDQLVNLGYKWLGTLNSTVPGSLQNLTRTIQLFQAITLGYQKVNGAGVDGVIDPGGRTEKWLWAQNAPRWHVIADGLDGEGFVNYAATQACDNHKFGTHWLTEVITGAGRKNVEISGGDNPLFAPIAINDVSLPRGGYTKAHAGHQTGMSCDIRLPHTKRGLYGGITFRDNQYNLEAMSAQLMAFTAHPLVTRIFFNDDRIKHEKIKYAGGHDDHAHIEIKPPDRVDA
jgi:Penicillin-insensitive murein endopeptidase